MTDKKIHEELHQMKVELAAMLRNNRLLRSAVQEVNRIDMVRGSLILRASNHDKVPVEKILEGQLPKEVPVKEYVFIENFSNLVRIAYSNLDMGNSLDKHLLVNGYRILSENENGYYRRSNPVVYAFNHVPPHAVDVEDRLDDFLRRVYSRQSGDNIVLKAMYIHNKIIDIYPFEEYNGELAIFALNYYLLENGLAPIGMALTRQEYQSQISDCLKGIHQEAFYQFLCGAIYDKMKGTLEACREYIKNQD